MSWKAACPTGDVKQDKIKECTIDGVDIILVNVGDGFRAYPPVCPHMEQYLEGSGICANNIMTCDRHLWQWDMKTGEPLGPAEKPLLIYDTKEEDGQVMVFIDEELEYDFDDDDQSYRLVHYTAYDNNKLMDRARLQQGLLTGGKLC